MWIVPQTPLTEYPAAVACRSGKGCVDRAAVIPETVVLRVVAPELVARLDRPLKLELVGVEAPYGGSREPRETR